MTNHEVIWQCIRHKLLFQLHSQQLKVPKPSQGTVDLGKGEQTMADMTSRAEIGITGILGWTTVYCYQATRHVPSYHNHVFSLTESKHSGKKKNKRQKHWCWREEDKERRPSTNRVYSLSHFCMWKIQTDLQECWWNKQNDSGLF